jgi:hypothetical protein
MRPQARQFLANLREKYSKLKETAMLNKIIMAAVAVLAALLLPSKVDAWGAARVGGVAVGPRGGVYAGSRTVVSGPRGVAVGGRSAAVGPYGGGYRAGYAGGAGYGGGYRYNYGYSGGYGGAVGGYRYGYIR